MIGNCDNTQSYHGFMKSHVLQTLAHKTEFKLTALIPNQPICNLSVTLMKYTILQIGDETYETPPGRRMRSFNRKALVGHCQRGPTVESPRVKIKSASIRLSVA